jgi:hypothetical protein
VPPPNRSPLACGALGPYERGRVATIAELLDGDQRVAYEDPDAILMLDRDPIEWSGGGQRGLGWAEGDARRPPAQLDGWTAAADAGVCGLVLEGRKRFLHSAVNGLAPVYWLEDGGAIYFCSRIDPLVRSSPERLSIDWDAWAAILALRYPLDLRTPFAEIRRLPQSSRLRRRFGRPTLSEDRWPWSEMEPVEDQATSAERIVAALEDSLAPLPGGIVCPLSGGRDSRMLFLALAREGKVASAATVPDDEGGSFEEDLAAAVADAFGVPHERLRGEESAYAAEWEERARRVEYEFVDHAWLVPLSNRLAGGEAPVPDGFAIDSFFSIGRHFYTPETLDISDPDAASQALFETLRRYGRPELALEESFREPLVARAREQFLDVASRYEGHSAQTFLTFYTTRSRRGVSTYATKLLGDRSQVIVPGASDAFARAGLSASVPAKLGGGLYRAVFETIAPAAAAIPSTAEAPRPQPHLPRRWCSPAALEALRGSLLEGPFAPHLSAELRGWTEGSLAEPPAHLRLAGESLNLLHAWWRRYRDHLRPVDPADLRG